MSFGQYLWMLASVSGSVVKSYLLAAGGNSSGEGGLGSAKIDQLNNGTVYNSYASPLQNLTVFTPPGYKSVAFNNSVPIPDPDGWRTIFGVFQHCVATMSDGTILATGSDAFGQCGQGTSGGTHTYYKPVIFGGGDENSGFIDGGGGTEFSAGLKSDGTIWVWGRNDISGVCANGTKTGNVLVPHGIHKTSKTYNVFPVDTQFKKFSVGHRFILALDQHGQIWAWGNNGNRQLGRSHRYLSSDPAPNFTQDYYVRRTPNTDPLNASSADPASENTGLYTNTFVEISAGAYHGGAIDTDGKLIMWGSNSNGQCHSTDTGLIMPHEVPSPVQGRKWARLFCGEYSTAAILDDGTAWVWGKNTENHLGLASAVDRTSAEQLPGVWRLIKIGLHHGLGIKNDGTLWAWGAGASGKLGTGSTANSPTPVQIGSSTAWSDVAPMDATSQVIMRA